MESIKDIQDIGISEYGTRRRFSKAWQEEVIKTMQATMGKQFTGTSNVYYAMRLGLTPLGTMAHEYLQACQALGPRLRDSQNTRLKCGQKSIAAISALLCPMSTA